MGRRSESANRLLGREVSGSRAVFHEGHPNVNCALVVWRDWIDQAADDPRHELAFHAQLSDYSRGLRQEGGGVTRAWIPGAPLDEWVF
jgi:hypothetical protein